MTRSGLVNWNVGVLNGFSMLCASVGPIVCNLSKEMLLIPASPSVVRKSRVSVSGDVASGGDSAVLAF